MSSVETLSPSLMRTGPATSSPGGLPDRHLADVGTLDDGRILAVGGRQDEAGGGGGEARRKDHLGCLAQTPRIGDHAAQGGRARRLGGREVDLVALDSASPREVPVEGPQAPRAGGRDVADAGARAARRLGDDRARRDEVRHQTLARHRLEDLLAGREEDERDVRVNAPAAQNLGDDGHVLPRAVRARADQDLLDRRSLDLADGDDVVRGPGKRDERLDCREVDLERVVVAGIGVGGEGPPGRVAPEAREVAPGDLVRGEDRRGQAELGAHVRDRRALGHRQGRHARTRVLEDLAEAPADGESPEQLEDDVLGGDPGPEPARQHHLDDAGQREVVGAPAHGAGDVEAARADRQHPESAAERRVAVRAEKGESGRPEGLEMDLMADAVAGLRVEAAEAPRGGLEVPVILRVAGVELIDLVVRVRDHGGRLDAIEAHRLELEPGHGAVRVREEDLVHPETDLLTGQRLARHQVSGHELLDEALGHQAPRAGAGRSSRGPGPT